MTEVDFIATCKELYMFCLHSLCGQRLDRSSRLSQYSRCDIFMQIAENYNIESAVKKHAYFFLYNVVPGEHTFTVVTISGHVSCMCTDLVFHGQLIVIYPRSEQDFYILEASQIDG